MEKRDQQLLKDQATIQQHSTPSCSEPIAPDHRSQELEWCQTHREALQAFTSQWVVLEGEQVIAHGEDPVQVVTEARARGIKVPYIFYVEPRDEDVVRIGL